MIRPFEFWFAAGFPSERVLDLADPRFVLDDVRWMAKSLADEVRYLSDGIPVLDHSVACYNAAVRLFPGASREAHRAVLLHDFEEAIIRDVPSPVVRLMDDLAGGAEHNTYRKLKAHIRGALERDFGYSVADHRMLVSDIDALLLLLERDAIYGFSHVWEGPVEWPLRLRSDNQIVQRGDYTLSDFQSFAPLEMFLRREETTRP